MRKIIRFLNSTGDQVLEFDETDADAAQKAHEAIAKAIRNGATAFDVSAGPNTPAKRVESPAQLGNETVVVPRIVGG